MLLEITIQYVEMANCYLILPSAVYFPCYYYYYITDISLTILCNFDKHRINYVRYASSDRLLFNFALMSRRMFATRIKFSDQSPRDTISSSPRLRFNESRPMKYIL